MYFAWKDTSILITGSLKPPFFLNKGCLSFLSNEVCQSQPSSQCRKIVTYTTGVIFMSFILYRNLTFTIKQENKQKCASCWKGCLWTPPVLFSVQTFVQQKIEFQFRLNTQSTWFMATVGTEWKLQFFQVFYSWISCPQKAWAVQ